MCKSHLNTISRKLLQLEAMLAVLNVADEAAHDELDANARGNFNWLMADLVAEIRAELNGETGVQDGE
jgi:hypothetical protein